MHLTAVTFMTLISIFLFHYFCYFNWLWNHSSVSLSAEKSSSCTAVFMTFKNLHVEFSPETQIHVQTFQLLEGTLLQWKGQDLPIDLVSKVLAPAFLLLSKMQSQYRVKAARHKYVNWRFLNSETLGLQARREIKWSVCYRKVMFYRRLPDFQMCWKEDWRMFTLKPSSLFPKSS